MRLGNDLPDCVVVDCETTGLDPSLDRVIEVAALRIHNGTPVALFHRLIDPGRTLPPAIARLTGFSDLDLCNSCRMEDVLEGLLEFLGELPVVGHNVRFDLEFLRAAADRTHVRWDTRPHFFCTAEAARTLIPRKKVGRYRLSTLSDVLELEHRPRHRAVDDVLATLDLLHHLNGLAARTLANPTQPQSA